MILHDTIEVRMTVSFDPPQYSDYGEEIFDNLAETVRGEVFALDTEVTEVGVSTRYRMVLAPTVTFPRFLNGDKLRFGWGAYPINPADPFDVTSGLRLDGSVERHILRGRLHHYELITTSVE